MDSVKAGIGRFRFSERLRSLTRRRRPRTFILPTGFGLAFGVMGLVLLMMAMSYANNLIYLYAFALISVGLSSMYVTNQNVERAQPSRPLAGRFYADESGFFHLEIANPSSAKIRSLEAFFAGHPPSACEEIPPRGAQDLRLEWRPVARGWQKTPKLRVQSEFPFGLFRAWKTPAAPGAVLVFPARRGDPRFPASASASPEAGNLGLFRDHRPFQSTDSPRRVDWRATARAQEILVKNYEGSEQASFRFSWAQTAALTETEARLSQLSLWITLAEERGSAFSLELPAFSSGLGQGSSHAELCLRKLALFQGEPG